MAEEPFDLLIRGGTVIDGTGAPGYAADVAVRGDRIAAVGPVEGPARRVIEAQGLVVSPGFIDVHAHDDAAVIASPAVDFKLMQGVTTDIVGNCGLGVAPAAAPVRRALEAGAEADVLGPVPEDTWRTFREYMQAVEAAHPALNVGCLVPHGVVRTGVMMLERRPPDPAELAAMREAVAEGMAVGALGLSTGLIYVPGRYAETAEIVEVAKAAAEAGGLYVSHIRDEGPALLEAVAEAVEIGREVELPVQISHHKSSGGQNRGMTVQSLRLIEQSRAEGVDVAFDVYPYTAASTILAALMRAPEEWDPEAVLVASAGGRAEYEGKTLAQIAEALELPVQEALERVLREERGAVAVFFIMDESDVQRVMKHPLSMIGSDGIPSPTGKPHPRLYGTFPRVLGRYVREEKLLGLEEAVHKMSGRPARRFQLAERGEVRESWSADLVVFDPRTVAETATYEEPRRYPTGIECVIVNGEVAAEGGRQTEARAGRVLRRAVSAARR